MLTQLFGGDARACENYPSRLTTNTGLLRGGRRDSSQLPHLRRYVTDQPKELWSNYQKLHDNGSGILRHFHRLLSKRAKISRRGVP
jgi:hypothetical protein